MKNRGKTQQTELTNNYLDVSSKTNKSWIEYRALKRMLAYQPVVSSLAIVLKFAQFDFVFNINRYIQIYILFLIQLLVSFFVFILTPHI